MRRSLLLPLLFAGLAYGLIDYGVGLHAGRKGDPTYFIKAGRPFLAPNLLPPDPFIESSTGYDGQFFFYLSQDPLLNGKAASRDAATSPHIDSVPYRYQRILLPGLGWLTSWGDPSVLQWTLPLINLIAVLAATYLLAGFLRARGRSPWIAVVFALSIGMVVGVVNDLSDPLAAALFVAGLVWWLERRTVPAVVVLAACLLARETYLLPVALICLSELVRTRGRGALPWLIPLGVFGVWQLYLRLALTGSPTAGAAKPSIVPLLGAARKVREVLREDVLGAANWELLFIGLLLAIVAFFAVRSAEVTRAVLRTRSWPSREQLMPVVALATLVLVPFLTLELWRNTLSYTRYGAPAAGLLLLAYAIRHDRWSGGLLLSVAALSLTNPVVPLLPNKQPGLIKPPPSPQQARLDKIISCLAVPGSGHRADRGPRVQVGEADRGGRPSGPGGHLRLRLSRGRGAAREQDRRVRHRRRQRGQADGSRGAGLPQDASAEHSQADRGLPAHRIGWYA